LPALYKAAYIDTIDSMFKIAKAIDYITKRYYGSGVQGSLAQALIQWGFTARDPDREVDKSIRAKLKEMLEEEPKVRSWWKSVPAQKKKFWLSAPTIYRNWKKDTAPVDADAPTKKRETPLQRERATNQLLQQKLREANDLLKSADGGNLFTANSSAEHVGDVVAEQYRTSPSKLRAIAARIIKRAKELEARIKDARPAGSEKKKRGKKAKGTATLASLTWKNKDDLPDGDGEPRQSCEAADGASGSYHVGPSFGFPGMKFCGYHVYHWVGGKDRRIGDNLRTAEQAKKLAERDHAERRSD
jgi:hypothetical protein